MRNPWPALTEKCPYVLAEDKTKIDRARPRHRLELNTLPEPFIGNPNNARVILLNLNPGKTPRNKRWERWPAFRKSYRANLAHRPARYPFFVLDPRFAKTPSGSYWRFLLRPLLERCCHLRVAQRLAVVEWLAYHSKHCDWPDGEVLHSQEYASQLIRGALKRNVLVVIMRAKQRWLRVVPELTRLPRQRLIVLRNPQNVVLSPGNMRRGDFDMLCCHIGGCRSSV